jgi:hypothetical protein
VIRRAAAALLLLATLSGAAQAASLVAWWRLDETSGTALADSTGNGHGATISGTSTLGATVSSVIRFADTGAVTFSGTSNSASGSATGLPATNANVSISGWFKLAASPAATGEMVCIAGSGAQQYRIAIKPATGGGTIEVDKNSAVLATVASLGLVSGTWYHLATTYNGTNDLIYLNGTQVGTGAVLHDSAAAVTVFIGARNASTELFAGTIDDVRVFDYALSAAQVAGLAAGGPEDHAQWFGLP